MAARPQESAVRPSCITGIWPLWMRQLSSKLKYKVIFFQNPGSLCYRQQGRTKR